MNQVLSKISGVRPEEGRRTLWATLFYFFFIAHVVMVKSAANALFLSRHNPALLPLLYILVAVVVAVIVLFASNTLADPRRRGLRLLSLAFVGLVLLISWVLLYFDWVPISPVLYLFVEVAITALNIQFWSVAGDIFDPQEGKRVFGVLAGGGMSGSIFGGLFVHQLGSLLGTVNLLLTASASLAFSLVAAWALTKHPGRTDSIPQGSRTPLRVGLRYVFTNAYPRTFGLLMLLGMVLTSFVDFFFRTSAQQLLGEDQLAVLFGDLNIWVGVISVSFLFLFSNRILRRIGIFYYLFIVPGLMASACVLSLLFPVFLVVYALKIIENAGSMSINQAALQLMYNPIRTDLRAPVRGTIDGLLRKLGYAVGGLILFLFADRLSQPTWQFVILSMLIVFCLLLMRLRTLYLRLLFRRLRVSTSKPVNLRLEDASSHKALLAGLESGDVGLIVTSLGWLKNIPSIPLHEPLMNLIDHLDERVRIAAMETIVARGYQQFLYNLLGIINTGSQRCRVEALRAVVALDPTQSGDALVPYLNSPEESLVAAAIEQLLRLRGYGLDNPAVTVLEKWLEKGTHGSLAQRMELARLLGELGQSRYALHLAVFLKDPDDQVRRLAALSCKQVQRMEFVPQLLVMLSDREVRKEAREALAAYGDKVLDILETWLNDRDRPLNLRLRLPRLIRMISTHRAGEVLLFSNIQDHAILRYRIALSLSGIRSSPEVCFDRKWALDAVERRLDAYRYYVRFYLRLVANLAVDALVIRALRDRLHQNIEVAFRVLGLIYSHRTLMSIHHRLLHPSVEVFQDALELLDNVLDRDIGDRLLPILENHKRLFGPRAFIGPRLPSEQVEQDLLTLTESKDVTLSACAVHTRCVLGQDCAEQYPVLSEGEETVEIIEKVLFLESVDIFRQNNLDDLTALAAITTERDFHAGQTILREGDPGDALFIITKGEVEIVKGYRKLLRLQEKTSLGGVSLLDQKPHAASAVCTVDCSTLVIDRIDFMDLVSDRVELLHGIFLALTDRLRALLAVTEGGGLATENQFDDGNTNPV